MTSEWTFGKVTFPVAPERIGHQIPTNIQKSVVLSEAPWLYSFGPDTEVLLLEGELMEEGNDLDTIEASYVKPLRKYAKQKSVFPAILMDENPNEHWDVSGCVAANFSGGNQVRKGKQCFNVDFKNSDAAIYRNFTEDQRYKDNNFISFWYYANSNYNGVFYLNIYNNTFGTKGDRLFTTFGPSDGEGFYHVWASISSADHANAFSISGTPSWDNVRCVAIEVSGGGDVPDDLSFFIDRMVIGVGWRLDAPGTERDGFWLIKQLQFEEGGGNIESYRYRMTFWDQRDYYGENE